MANAKLDEKTEGLFGSLVLVDNIDTDTTDAVNLLGYYADLSQSLAKNDRALAVADDFLKSTRDRYGFGPATSLFVDFVNMTFTH
jgi:hypothetical protein